MQRTSSPVPTDTLEYQAGTTSVGNASASDSEALRLIADFIHRPWPVQERHRKCFEGLGMQVDDYDPARKQLMDDIAQVMSTCWKQFEGKIQQTLHQETRAIAIGLQDLAKDRALQEEELKRIRVELNKIAAGSVQSGNTTDTAEPIIGLIKQKTKTSERQTDVADFADKPPSVHEDVNGIEGKNKKMQHLLKMRSMRTYANETLQMHVHAPLVPDGHVLSRVVKWWTGLETVKGTGRLAAIVDSLIFQAFCICIILVHALISTLGLNAEMRHALSGTSDPAVFSEYERYFLIWYCVEVFCRCLAHRLHFFLGREEWGWNLFDFVLVIQGILDEALAMFTTGNMLILRPLRLFKVVRVLRTIRAVRFLQELRLMVMCIVTSVQTLLWCVVLLMFIQYFFSMFLVQGMADYVNSRSDGLMAEEGLLIEKFFSSVQTSALTLWMAVTGGEDWGPLYSIIDTAGEWQGRVFIFFTAFFVIAALNIVTGTFVNKAFNIAKPDPDTMAKMKNLQEADYARRLKSLFRFADRDDSGGLTKEELIQIFEHERHSLLEIIGVSNVDTEALYDLLEVGEEGDEVNIDGFVTGLLMLSGPGRSIDLHIAEHRILNMLEVVEQHTRKTSQLLSRVSWAV